MYNLAADWKSASLIRSLLQILLSFLFSNLKITSLIYAFTAIAYIFLNGIVFCLGGLLINICGLFMFGSDAHGHDHGNHSHSNSEQANGNCQKPHSDVESGKTSKTSSESSKV